MYFFAAALIGVVAALPALMWARHQDDSSLRVAAGWGLLLAASVYVLFALQRGDGFWKLLELIGLGLYGCFYWFSVKQPLKILAIGWLLHPLWDIFLHIVGAGSFLVPEWYGMACVIFDLLVGSYLWWRYHQAKSLPPELRIVH